MAPVNSRVAGTGTLLSFTIKPSYLITYNYHDAVDYSGNAHQSGIVGSVPSTLTKKETRRSGSLLLIATFG